MGIIKLRQRLRKLQVVVGKLEVRYDKAKDKERWRKKNGLSLSIARKQANRIQKELLTALRTQGQFQHRLLGEELPEETGDV